MAQAKQLGHRRITNPALGYDSYGSPIKSSPVFIAGQNVLTSSRQIAELRPGFSPLEPTPTIFPGGVGESLVNLFIWHKWDSTTYVMAVTLQAPTFRIYKFKIGVDTSFSLLTSFGNGVTPRFIVSNNTLFICNAATPKKWDGTTLSNWGITAPSVTPTTSLSGTGITANTGWYYVYCYYNSNTGHVSSPSPPSLSTGPVANQTVNIHVVQSADPQVTGIRIFRSTDGGGGIFYEISPPGSFPNVTGNYQDTTADVNLSTVVAPVPGFNDPPPASIYFTTWYQNRIWAADFNNRNKVYFSGWEEIGIGVEEECFPSGPAGNFYALDSFCTGLAATTDFVCFTTPISIHKITGDSLDTFVRSFIVQGMGLSSQAAISGICSYGRSVVWFNTDDSVRVTDGNSVIDISVQVRNDIQTVSTSATPVWITVFNHGVYHYLMVMFADGIDSFALVYDLDMEQWMPPWRFNAGLVAFSDNPIFAGNIQPSGDQILIWGSQHKVLQFDPTVNTDDSSNIDSFVVTNLFDIIQGGAEIEANTYTLGAPPGHIGEPEYLAVETNSILPTSVRLLTDEDPFVTNFGEPISEITDPALRIQGVNLLEKWYYQRMPGARRCAVRLDWTGNGTHWKLYSFDLAYRQMT